MATCIERTFVYYNFPSCNLVPLEAEQNDFRRRETNICVQGNIIFTDHFRPSSISLFVSLPVIIIRYLCFVKFSVCQTPLCDHASVLVCV